MENIYISPTEERKEIKRLPVYARAESAPSMRLTGRDRAILEAIQAFEPGLAVSLMNGAVLIVGTIASLAYFQFGILTRPNQTYRPQAWIASLGQIGQVFVAIAFGFIFAGVLSAALVALIERLVFLVDFIETILLPWIT